MIRHVYPAENSFLPRILREKIRPGHAYQAHPGIVGVTVGNHHAYSFPAHVFVSFQGCVLSDEIVFPGMFAPPCVSRDEYRQSVYGVQSFDNRGGSANFLECGGPPFGVESVVRHGTGER